MGQPRIWDLLYFHLSKPELAVISGVQRGLIQKQIALESGLGASSIARAVSSLKRLFSISETASYDDFVLQIRAMGVMEVGSVAFSK